MISVFDYFQFITLLIFLVVFIGRSIILYTRHGINPLVLGVGKTGFRRYVELSFFVGLVFWIVEILIQVFHWEWHIFGSFFAIAVVNSFLAKITGMILIVLSFVLFLLDNPGGWASMRRHLEIWLRMVSLNSAATQFSCLSICTSLGLS